MPFPLTSEFKSSWLRWLSHHRHLMRIVDMFQFARRRLDEDRLPQVAGSLTFTTVLALVPMLTIALAIFTTFPLFNAFRTALDAYFIQNLMPKSIANTILGYLGQFSAKASGLSAIGAIALMVTSIATMGTIERAFNDIWRVKASRPLAKRIVMYWAIVTLGPLLIGISMSLTSYLFSTTSSVVMHANFAGAVLYTLVSVVITALAFTLLYTTVPNRYVDWRDAMWGGIAAGIAFEIAKRLFAVFIKSFPTYTMVYGAVAALPIFLIWIYMSWLITLIGAVITASLPVVKYERWWHVATPATAFADAMTILRTLFDARKNGMSAAVDAGKMRELTRLGFDESENLLQQMVEVGWVGRIKPDRWHGTSSNRRVAQGLDSWILLGNPQLMTLADVYRLFMFDAAGNVALAAQVENAISLGLTRTLQDYFSSADLSAVKPTI